MTVLPNLETGAFLYGSLKCEINGRGSTSFLGLYLSDDGPGRGGAGQVNIKADDWTNWDAETLDLDGGYSTTATIKGSLATTDNFENLHRFKSRATIYSRRGPR